MKIFISSLLMINSFLNFMITVKGNSDCKFISGSKHHVSSKDFKVTSIHEKYIMCGAYFCSNFPTVLPLQLLIHEINSTKDNLAVYLEKKSITPFNNCGPCKNKALQNNILKEEQDCRTCPQLEPSKTIDLYVRLEKPSNFDSNSEECVWNINFNMSVQEYTCQESLTVNIPQGNDCNVSMASNSDLQCVTPTCSKDIIVKTDVDNFIHTFVPTNKSETCIWELHIDPTKTLHLIFSPFIRNHLTVYENSLLTPKWSISKCDNISDNIKFKSTYKRVFILYKSEKPISSEGFLQVNVTKEACPRPLAIKNGFVEFKESVNGTTFAHYSCFENYHLIGEKIGSCDNEKNPPACVEDKEHLFLADGPTNSNENVTDKSKIDSLRININVSVVDPSFRELNPDSSFNKTLMKSETLLKLKKEKVDSTESESTRSNISLIELDTGISETGKISNDVTTISPSEGSGHSRMEDDSFSDMSDSELNLETETLVTLKVSNENVSISFSNVSFNSSFGSPWHPSEGGIILFSLPSLEDKMLLFILIGAGVFLVVIITVISLIICRNRSVRSGLNRKFDTFQNPIYEKPVVHVPIPVSDSDQSHEKLDLGDLSDSTVLD